jgi:hypothetical protein
MTPHPYASVIKAAADGATVQSRNKYSKEWSDWCLCVFPDFNLPDYEWRVKPQTLRYRVALMKGDTGLTTSVVNSEVVATAYEEFNMFVRWLHDWQEVEV